MVGLAALVFVAGPALAFQQTEENAAIEAQPEVAAETGPITLETPQVQEQDTEVTIPGLGSIGVLPKLDFGLELLYGANEPTSADDLTPEDSEVLIQGRVKHKF